MLLNYGDLPIPDQIQFVQYHNSRLSPWMLSPGATLPWGGDTVVYDGAPGLAAKSPGTYQVYTTNGTNSTFPVVPPVFDQSIKDLQQRIDTLEQRITYQAMTHDKKLQEATDSLNRQANATEELLERLSWASSTEELKDKQIKHLKDSQTDAFTRIQELEDDITSKDAEIERLKAEVDAAKSAKKLGTGGIIGGSSGTLTAGAGIIATTSPSGAVSLGLDPSINIYNSKIESNVRANENKLDSIREAYKALTRYTQ